MNWPPIIGYLLGALIAGRVTALRLMRTDNRDDVGFLAVLVAIFWPLALILFAILGSAHLLARLFTAPTRAQREQRKREKVARLAKELDLPWSEL